MCGLRVKRSQQHTPPVAAVEAVVCTHGTSCTTVLLAKKPHNGLTSSFLVLILSNTHDSRTVYGYTD
jgi:hypothetical protein